MDYLVLILMILIFVILFWLRASSERKQYSKYEESNENPYDNIEATYSGFILTSPSNVYQTNRIKILLSTDSIILIKKGFSIVTSKYYSLKFDSSNLFNLEFYKINSSKAKLTLYHKAKDLESPYKVRINFGLDSSKFELLEEYCNNYSNQN